MKIPVRIRMCIAPGTRTVKSNTGSFWENFFRFSLDGVNQSIILLLL